MLILKEIDDLVDNIRKHPEDTEKYKRECGDKLRGFTSDQVKSAITTIFVNLYDGQIRSLKRDLGRCILSGGKDADPNERIELLRCLFGTLRLYFKDDYSLLTDMCEQEIQRRLQYGEGIEDSDEEVLFEL